MVKQSAIDLFRTVNYVETGGYEFPERLYSPDGVTDSTSDRFITIDVINDDKNHLKYAELTASISRDAKEIREIESRFDGDSTRDDAFAANLGTSWHNVTNKKKALNYINKRKQIGIKLFKRIDN